MKILFFIVISFIGLTFTTKAYALQITEIYPAPLLGEKEWVELYNNEEVSVDLTQYSITDAKDNKLEFETTIASPSSYFIASGSNVLNNAGPESVILKHGTETISTVSYSENFSTNTSFIRCPNLSTEWIISNTQTKKNSNETVCQINTPTPSSVLTVTPTVISTYDHIYISEVMTYPSENMNEWVELYNDNDFTVNLQKWYIDDAENSGSSPKQFSLSILPKSYAVYELTSGIFNNDTDEVRLLDTNNSLKDSFVYSDSIEGKTWGRINPTINSLCLLEMTKSTPNISCTAPTAIPTTYITPTKIPTVTLATTIQVASVSATIKSTPMPTIKKILPTIAIPQSLFTASPTSDSAMKQMGTVLGTKTSNHKNDTHSLPLSKILAAISMGISILTIGMVFIRMRNKVNSLSI